MSSLRRKNVYEIKKNKWYYAIRRTLQLEDESVIENDSIDLMNPQSLSGLDTTHEDPPDENHLRFALSHAAPGTAVLTLLNYCVNITPKHLDVAIKNYHDLMVIQKIVHRLYVKGISPTSGQILKALKLKKNYHLIDVLVNTHSLPKNTIGEIHLRTAVENDYNSETIALIRMQCSRGQM